MKRYSSSVLKIFNRNCPQALGFYEDEAPYDRELFQQGIAAHAVLQVVGEKRASGQHDILTVADAVVTELITKGRSYKGRHEPPMSPEDAMAGRDIALQYLYEYPLNLPDNSGFEVQWAINDKGKACLIGEDSQRYDAIFDVLYTDIEGDEDYATDVIVVRDYKSAWPTGANELDTMQVKGHAVIAWQHFKDRVGGVRNEIVNLRTKQIYTRTTYFDEEGIKTLQQWTKDILTACSAADTTREARPGAGCIGCFYTLSCPDCLEYYQHDTNIYITFATLKAQLAELGKIVRNDAKVEPIEVPGGEIAYRGQNEKVATEEAIDKLIEYWWMDRPDGTPLSMGEVRGLLTALDVKATSYEKAAKVLFPDKLDAAYMDMIEACITVKTKSRFDVYKK